MGSRVPPLLEPYLSLTHETSLILLTGVLGASTNWLVLRYLHRALQPEPQANPEIKHKVVLVSFLRDFVFWKDGAKKLGLDLLKLAKENRFEFVDGLGGLFLSSPGGLPALTPAERVIRSAELTKVYDDILASVRALQTADDVGWNRRVVLIIDGLDLLLATCPDSVHGPVQLGEMLLDLREENFGTTILTLSGDAPLLSGQNTPLEINHAAFVLNVAHQAKLVMSLRLMDTGTARDISGVIRITEGGGADKVGNDAKLEEKELLYFVGKDSGLRVFERGQ